MKDNGCIVDMRGLLLCSALKWPSWSTGRKKKKTFQRVCCFVGLLCFPHVVFLTTSPRKGWEWPIRNRGHWGKRDRYPTGAMLRVIWPVPNHKYRGNATWINYDSFRLVWHLLRLRLKGLSLTCWRTNSPSLRLEVLFLAWFGLWPWHGCTVESTLIVGYARYPTGTISY